MLKTIMLIVSLFIFILPFKVSAAKMSILPKEGIFSGRVSKINDDAGLVRIRSEFENIRYVNKKDKLEFWDPHYSQRICKALVVGKSPRYILLKIPNYKLCTSAVHFAVGSYLKFFSQDLVNNLKMGKEVVEILLKKRLAINGQLSRSKKRLDSYIEKVDAVNGRYSVLRSKLEREWKKDLGSLEEDRLTSLRNYKQLELRLNELDHKLERYKVDDSNLYLDRWALDPRQFIEK